MGESVGRRPVGVETKASDRRQARAAKLLESLLQTEGGRWAKHDVRIGGRSSTTPASSGQGARGTRPSEWRVGARRRSWFGEIFFHSSIPIPLSAPAGRERPGTRESWTAQWQPVPEPARGQSRVTALRARRAGEDAGALTETKPRPCSRPDIAPVSDIVRNGFSGRGLTPENRHLVVKHGDEDGNRRDACPTPPTTLPAWFTSAP